MNNLRKIYLPGLDVTGLTKGWKKHKIWMQQYWLVQQRNSSFRQENFFYLIVQSYLASTLVAIWEMNMAPYQWE